MDHLDDADRVALLSPAQAYGNIAKEGFISPPGVY
jgi:hypothetical protein